MIFGICQIFQYFELVQIRGQYNESRASDHLIESFQKFSKHQEDICAHHTPPQATLLTYSKLYYNRP